MADFGNGLPRDLGDGLLLRWATPDDAAALAEFNIAIHSELGTRDEGIGHHTCDLMSGRHPTTSAADFTIVVNTRRDNQIVSSLCTISQTWRFADISFGVGRPELVGTLPAYRRRGLVRQQMAVIHQRSTAKGELVQAITGLPWYYRQFGYEMGLDLHATRWLAWRQLGDPPGDAAAFRLRPATTADIPLLAELFAAHCAGQLISRVRTPAEWLFELHGRHPQSIIRAGFQLITRPDGEPVGYVNAVARRQPRDMHVQELAVRPGQSLRAVAIWLGHHWRETAEEWAGAWTKRPLGIRFELGPAHPVYDALGRQLEDPGHSYAWYLRVPDLGRFLRHVSPEIDRRLASSVMAGHSGTTRLNFYRSTLTLVFDQGRLAAIGSYEPREVVDGDGFFPDLTFLQLLFGYRSLAELDAARADCFTNDETAVLLDVLFPKRPSLVNVLS